MHFGHLWPRRHTLRVATRLDMSFMLVYMFSSNLLHYYSNMERAFFSPNKHGWCKGRQEACHTLADPRTVRIRKWLSLLQLRTQTAGDPMLRTQIIHWRKIRGSAHLCWRPQWQQHSSFAYCQTETSWSAGLGGSGCISESWLMMMLTICPVNRATSQRVAEKQECWRQWQQ